jgi:cytochrome P450
MCIKPEIQKKAQLEINEVMGRTRLPSYEDRESLPYTEAIYREVLRWRSPLLLGIPHYSTQDDHYKGYFIPKGMMNTRLFNV